MLEHEIRILFFRKVSHVYQKSRGEGGSKKIKGVRRPWL